MSQLKIKQINSGRIHMTSCFLYDVFMYSDQGKSWYVAKAKNTNVKGTGECDRDAVMDMQEQLKQEFGR